MLPIRWDPFKDMSRELGSLHHELDEVFRRTFGTGEMLPVEGRGPVPAVNTFVKGNTYHFQAELPGLKKEDLDINLEGQMLTICGERKESREAREGGYQVKESRFGSSKRQVTLPEGVDTDKVHATYEDGMLEITMPIAKAAAGRKIAIEGGKKKDCTKHRCPGCWPVLLPIRSKAPQGRFFCSKAQGIPCDIVDTSSPGVLVF